MTQELRDLEIGSELQYNSEKYTQARVVRSRLKKKGFDFQFKLGKGILTVKRTA